MREGLLTLLAFPASCWKQFLSTVFGVVPKYHIRIISRAFRPNSVSSTVLETTRQKFVSSIILETKMPTRLFPVLYWKRKCQLECFQYHTGNETEGGNEPSGEGLECGEGDHGGEGSPIIFTLK